ncbi:MAG TPA: class I SAM-dependent methyltransferase [Candidatus Lokiarchaeia archaeon]|nr:class I SAM-dependent methyltransferase [Candidatus Lokiarchaeia archaeon]
MNRRRSPKVPTRDSFFNEGAEIYKEARWMARIQSATTTRAMELLDDVRIGGKIDGQDKRNGIMLDLGCGNGFSTEVIMNHGFPFVVGLDVSQDMLALRHLDNPVVLADMTKLPFRPVGTFSTIISISALNFVSQEIDNHATVKKVYDRLATQLHNVLKPGGRCIIEFYPKSAAELDIITASFGSRAGFHGFLVIDKPGTRKEQKFLCLRAQI